MADAKPTVVRCPFPTAIVTRPSPNGNPGSYQTLVWSNDKDALFTGARTQVFELLLSPHEPAQLSAEPLELKARLAGLARTKAEVDSSDLRVCFSGRGSVRAWVAAEPTRV